MQNITIEITNPNALALLEDMEKRHLIKIKNTTDYRTLALAGEQISEEDFRLWVEYADSEPTFTLNEAEALWEVQKKKIEKHIR